jgi:hypothetical protein
MDAYFRWKFTALFLLLLVVILVHPFAPGTSGGRAVFVVTSTFFFAAAILSACQYKWQRAIALLLGLVCIAGKWSHLFFAGRRLFIVEIVDRAFQIVFLSFIVVMLVLAIFRKRTVTADSILGAFGGYLLIAVTWGITYSLVELVWPGSFHVTEPLEEEFHSSPDQRDWLLSYFSCCTLMTVGYGDVTPVRPVVRTLAVLEAMVGQLYLAVLVAVLVGAKVAQAGGASSRG